MLIHAPPTLKDIPRYLLRHPQTRIPTLEHTQNNSYKTNTLNADTTTRTTNKTLTKPIIKYTEATPRTAKPFNTSLQIVYTLKCTNIPCHRKVIHTKATSSAILTLTRRIHLLQRKRSIHMVFSWGFTSKTYVTNDAVVSMWTLEICICNWRSFHKNINPLIDGNLYTFRSYICVSPVKRSGGVFVVMWSGLK
jgi:hypothetical protein